MSGRPPIDEQSSAARQGDDLLPPEIRLRRESALRVRRRRRTLLDCALALTLAATVVALVPGLAVVAIGAVLALALCGASIVLEPLRRRRP